MDVDKRARSAQNSQKACLLWFTGLSGAGKSTIVNFVEKKLYARGLHTYLLDGDNVRHNLNRDLGFTVEDRVENIRRVAAFVDAPLAVAEQRDPKGLYRKARRGELKNFTGIDSPYEPPEHAEIRIDTVATSPEGAADMIVRLLADRGVIGTA